MTKFYATPYWSHSYYDNALPYNCPIEVFEDSRTMDLFLYRSANQHPDHGPMLSTLTCPGQWNRSWLEIPGRLETLAWETPPAPFTSWGQLEVREEIVLVDGGRWTTVCFVTPKAPVYVITDITECFGCRLQLAPEHQAEKQE